MPYTAKGLWYPPSSNAPNIPLDFQVLANSVERGLGVDPVGLGVDNPDTLNVTQRVLGGVGMAVDVNFPLIAITGTWVVVNNGGQLTFCPNALFTNPTTLTVPANASGNPRVDSVFLQYTAATGAFSLVYTAGTPSGGGGATLDGRVGAPATPAAAMLVADIVVANGAANIVNANIRDRRPFNNGIPTLLTKTEIVALNLVPGMVPFEFGGSAGAAPIDLAQVAMACVLPKRIQGATKIRWRYRHGATAITGTYVIGIYDASGRKIIDTGAVSFTGAGNSIQVRSETITSTTFEPGIYYVFFGLDSTNAGVITYASAGAQLSPGITANMTVQAATGGTTTPQTLLGLTDAVSTGISQFAPLIAFSIA